MIRCAGLLLVCGAALLAGAATAEISEARYVDPTTRYAHGVLGDTVEYGALELSFDNGANKRIALPRDRVFEDTVPRLIQDPQGNWRVLVVESSLRQGARLALYDGGGLFAATPYIGRPHRWLAPVGAADLDGDGYLELAYIDRPHLAKRLRVWRLSEQSLNHVADQSGLTNHRIGWNHIPGGIRRCDGIPEMVTATGDWSAIAISTLRDGRITTREIGPYKDPDSLNTALGCP